MNPVTETSSDDTGGASAPASPSPINLGKDDAPTVLGKLRTLVQDKTRFEPQDITPLAEDDVQQEFSLQANYTLDARLEQRHINGHFTPSASDHCCASGDVTRLAQAQTKDRLRRAAATLETALHSADHGYDAIVDGLYLGHAVKQWHLDTCHSCAGHGRVDCTTCHGSTTETCWSCHGRRTVSCDAYGCYGSGKVSCSYCSGSGHVTEQVTDYVTVEVPTTVYENGSSRTSYHTETRTQYRNVQRNCHHCSYGKVTCNSCNGNGNVNCGTCRASGSVTCRTCSGVGDLRCNPCDASGQVGNAAWIDVHVAPAYSVSLPTQAPDDARRIRDKEGVRSLAALASSLALAKVSMYDPDLPQEVDALYAGKLRIVRLDAACNGQAHHLVAYGTDLRWLTLDDIVEKLLRGDLKALSDALAGSLDDGLFSSHVQGLLTPLRDVAASELNADVIEAVLSGEANHAHAGVVSPDYADSVRSCVLGALRQVYTRLAKQFWWKGLLAALGASYLLPLRQRASTAPVPALASAPVSPHVAAVPQDASAAKALKLYENGDKVQALAMLDVLVKKGNADAYGLYGWMTLMGEGQAQKPGQAAPTAQQRQAMHADAKPWITRALAKNDSYALAARGVMLAEGWQEQRNMPRALELLKQAAQKGNTEAMHVLGLYNMMGKGTPVNHKEARKWFTQAADKGSAGDIYNLGLMDWEGAGLKKPDRASAMQRWKIAAGMGEERAIKAVAQGKP